jgi:hypothetical protein
MFSNVADWVFVLFLVAIVYVLVRPRSKAAEAVDAIGQMMVALVRRAVDLAAGEA